MAEIPDEFARLLAEARAASEADAFREWLNTSITFACRDCQGDVTFEAMWVEHIQTDDTTDMVFYCPDCARNHPHATNQD